MGTANPNWDRWIKASVIQDFNIWNQARPIPYNKFVEGEERKTNQWATWLELRVDETSKFQYSQDFWRLELDISVLCNVAIDLDLYGINKVVGDASSWFKVGLCVFKYGNVAGDDPTAFVGTLQQTNIGRENLVVRSYGQVEPKTKLQQSTITAHYFIDIP